MKKIKKIKIIICISIGVSILIFYFCMSIFFLERFCYGTKINGMNFGGSTTFEVETQLLKEFDSYGITLVKKDGSVETLTKEDIGLKFDIYQRIEEIKKKQKPILWILYLIKPPSYQIEIKKSYDEVKLKEAFHNLSMFDEENITKPVNAYIKHTKDGFTVVEEIYGNEVNPSVLYSLIEEALKEDKLRLVLEENLCYNKPRITKDSKEITEVINNIKKYTDVEITYDFISEEEKLDGDTIHQWLSLKENDIRINKRKVSDFVQNLKDKYDTVGSTRNFTTNSGKKIKVSGGNYGWRIDKDKEIEELLEMIKRGESGKKEPVYSSTARTRGKNDIGDTYVEINLSKQHMWFYKNGKLIVHTNIVSGNVKEHHKTPAMVAYIRYKERNTTLDGPDYSSPVSYWMPIWNGIGIHDANWRSNFGGKIYLTNGSHGCINTPYNAMKKMYRNIDTGTPVVLYY